MGNSYFITRHQGAIDWARKSEIKVDYFVAHLVMPYDQETQEKDQQILLTALKKGDTVIGTLPVQIAEKVCAIGAEYWHLLLDIPANLRGENLNADQMKKCNARIVQYQIKEIKYV